MARFCVRIEKFDMGAWRHSHMKRVSALSKDDAARNVHIDYPTCEQVYEVLTEEEWDLGL